MQPSLGSSEAPIDEDKPTTTGGQTKRLTHLAIVLLGIWIGQFILFGPSLLGWKILLPLDILASPRYYIPITAETAGKVPQDIFRSDLLLQFEPERRFAASELAAGRMPVWQPFQYAGVPARLTVLSPLSLLKCCTVSPVIHAWLQLVIATIAGLGAYRFLRSVAGVGFLSATIPAWCYPLSGALMLWQGFPLTEVVCWLPWMLLAADQAVRHPTPISVGAVAVTSALALMTWQIDVGGLTLLATGIFSLWRIADLWLKPRVFPAARRAVLTLVLGWGCGFMLAAPYLLPMMEYISTGSRMEKRAEGTEERPPVGLNALPQAVLPDFYGTTKAGSMYFGANNLQESAASAYAGALAALLVAPLAWSSRRHRSINILCLVFIVLGLGWVADCPGLVELLRLPGFKMLSFNRFAFITGFAILVQAAIGLEVLKRNEGTWRKWYGTLALTCAALAGWCYYRGIVLPEPLATQLTQSVAEGKGGYWGSTLDDVALIQEGFRMQALSGGALCAMALLGWVVLWLRPQWQQAFGRVIGLVMLVELFFYAYGQSVQCDPSLYFPRIPALQQVVESEPGRIVGYSAMPANLAGTHELRDVRGYDAIDPKRYVELVSRAADPRSFIVPYAALQYLTPSLAWDEQGGLRLPPLLDLLGVRYAIFRGNDFVNAKPDFISPDYFVMVNRAALPQAFVPRRVALQRDPARRLDLLAAPDFDPRAVAYVETDVNLPSDCQGDVSVLNEIPTRVTLSVSMKTDGLVVLNDRWDTGWAAYLDGHAAPILIVNHALRGVLVPKGGRTLEFRYEPASFRWGLAACALAIIGLGFGTWWFCRHPRH